MSYQGKTYRLTSIDFLRGLVMVIMALDHVRDYFWDVRFDPLDLEQTNVVWYVTRWVTNFCAPIFVLLAGLSAGLMAKRRTKAELSRFLFTRGLWLIFIEVTVVTFAWTFQPLQNLVILQVIWAIGVSLIVMSVLVWTPKYFIAAFAIVMVFGHNLLDFGLFPMPVSFEVFSPFWHVLHNPVFTLDMGFPVVASYPIIPWIGVMPMGYLLAGLYRMEAEERQKWLIRMGLSAVILFVILRAINFYGDPNVWVAQKDMLWNILAFFNVTKYPPSLLYLLITLGPGLMMLGYAEKWRGRLVDGMVVFGQVPFFYYVLHLYVIHLAALLAAELQGLGWRATTKDSFSFPPEYGFGPLVVWALWFILILLLYPLCKWFADIKKRRSYWWLSYL
ncbi:MAG TPA: DUF1624 domain-containing protein [Sphingomonadales bacterium]|nr:DUF1624 domain-containing protein [Sphingomonadales bacterium]